MKSLHKEDGEDELVLLLKLLGWENQVAPDNEHWEYAYYYEDYENSGKMIEKPSSINNLYEHRWFYVTEDKDAPSQVTYMSPNEIIELLSKE